MPSPLSEQGPLPAVAYEVRVDIPAWGAAESIELDEDSVHVRSMELAEGLGEPFRLRVTLRSQDGRFDPSRLAGADVHLRMARHDPGNHGLTEGRMIRGVVVRSTYLGSFADAYEVSVEVAPTIGLLDTAPRSRIFQDRTVVEIAQDVWGEFLAPRGRSLVTDQLTKTYRPRDYCVQYQETDLAFITRILAEDGISFVFDHADEFESVVLIDTHETLRSAREVVEGPGDSSPLPVAMEQGDTAYADTETIVRLELQRDVHAAGSEVERWDWKLSPAANVSATVTPEGDVPPWRIGQIYEYDTRRLQEDQCGDGPHLDDALPRAMHRVDAQALRANARRGTSRVVGMSPGATFEVDGHPDSEFNQPYYCVRVSHRADNPEIERGAASTFAGPNYENEFVCTPLDQPLCPVPALRPRIYGPQTATVVGPDAEEIHTDRFGRIQVRMHWDREQRGQPTATSCWVRVAQSWAGAGWGAVFIPRVGMEVLITFLDGDPDRPLCMGSVYNGQNAPPYPLPDERTKSTIRTRSSPGGEGFNELRFDDAAGSEEVYIQAQKDLNELVKDAHTMRVGSSQTTDVGSNQVQTIGGNRNITITGTQRMTVDGAPTGEPPPDFIGHELEVTGDISQSATKTVTVNGDVMVTVVCGGSKIEITPNTITLNAGGGASLTLGAGVFFSSAGGGVSVDLSDTGVMQMTSSQAGEIKMDSTIAMTSAAGSVVEVTADIAMEAGSGATLGLDDAIELAGRSITATGGAGNVTIDGDVSAEGTSVKLSAGASKVELAASSATMSSASVTVQGMGQVSIGAPNVKIN